MTEKLTLIHERVDDIPLLIGLSRLLSLVLRLPTLIEIKVRQELASGKETLGAMTAPCWLT